MLFGAFLLGLPILRIRGDYLAIATLGFGEIIRILAGSDLLEAVARRTARDPEHPQAVRRAARLTGWPDPSRSTTSRSPVRRSSPSWRGACAARDWAARGSRSARTRTWPRRSASTWSRPRCSRTCWAAASPASAARSSAALVGSIFASSIQLHLSINVAAIIIVGGMGSIPGVVLGAICPDRPAGAVPRVQRLPPACSTASP